MDRLVTNLALMMWGTDHRKRHNILKVVLMNLLIINTKDPARYLSFHRGHDFYADLSKRYNPAQISRLISTIMDSLAKEHLIEHHNGHWTVSCSMGYVSKARSTRALMDYFRIYGLTPELIIRHPDTEVIILKDSKEWAFRNGRLGKVGGRYLEYDDTPEVVSMRERLRAYNRFMAGVSLEYGGQIIPTGPTHRDFNNTSWNHGGRFYGGFWQSKPDYERLTIRLNGEAVTELDYGSLHAHILYRRVGVIPTGDLYEIPDTDRDLVKYAVLLMIGAKRRSSVLKRLGEDIRKENLNIAAETIVNAIESRHPALSDLWFKGLGLDLQNIDSQICDQVLTAMTNAGIPCLSIYDSYVVPQVHRDALKSAMVAAFNTTTSTTYEPPIKEKRL